MHNNNKLLFHLTCFTFLFLPTLSLAMPMTTTDTHENIVFKYDNNTALKFSDRTNTESALQPCKNVGIGGLRYNAKIKMIEYCDGTIWQTPPSYTIQPNLTSSINYSNCISAVCDTGKAQDSAKSCQTAKSNILKSYYQQYGATGVPNIHLACPKDKVFVGSDLAPAPLPSSYISAFCCAMKLTAE